MPRPAAVLFDLFWTLIDVDASRLPVSMIAGKERRTTLPLWGPKLRHWVPTADDALIVKAFRTALGQSRAPDDTTERSSRLRFESILAELGCAGDVSEEAAVALSRAHMAGIADSTVCPESRREVMRRARSFARVGIVSNFDDTAGAYEILQRHGLRELCDTVVVSEAVGRRKPHPLPVLAALHTLDVEPEDAVMIGDDERADVGAGRNAGVDTVRIVRDGTAAEASRASVVVGALEEVPTALGW